MRNPAEHKEKRDDGVETGFHACIPFGVDALVGGGVNLVGVPSGPSVTAEASWWQAGARPEAGAEEVKSCGNPGRGRTDHADHELGVGEADAAADRWGEDLDQHVVSFGGKIGRDGSDSIVRRAPGRVGGVTQSRQHGGRIARIAFAKMDDGALDEKDGPAGGHALG